MPKAGYEGDIGNYDWGGFIDSDSGTVNPPAVETQPHYFLGGPATGSTPDLATFRALVPLDLPDSPIFSTIYLATDPTDPSTVTSRFTAIPGGIALEVYDVGLTDWVEVQRFA